MRASTILFLVCCTALAVNGDDGFKLAARAEAAAPGEFPFQVSIQANGVHFCGGSLITEKHVLTAGHCIHKYLLQPIRLYYERVTVEVGAILIGTGKSHDVIRLSRTSNYGNNHYQNVVSSNDVAVITLATPVKKSQYVQVIALPPASFVVPVGAKTIVSGFGSSTRRGPPSPKLQKTIFFTTDSTDCYYYYGNELGANVLSSNICAKRGIGYGTCPGDSGGPMVYNGMVVGIASAISGECGSGYPDLYTKVSSFIPYIEHELHNNGGPSDSISDVINMVFNPQSEGGTIKEVKPFYNNRLPPTQQDILTQLLQRLFPLTYISQA